MNLQKPTLGAIKDQTQLYTLLTAFYEQLRANAAERLPSAVPALKSVTLPLFADARKLRGDTLGELGPRACIVTGKASFYDGYEGAFLWDPTSTAADDEINILKVFGVDIGRWRRTSFVIDGDKGDVIVSGHGTVWTLDPSARASWTDFTVNLGAGDRAGTFDITGLSGLTAGKNVAIIQTAQPIASKGNARDEFEMEPILATGYVLDATTIRAYWHADSVVVGTYAFAYQVSA